MLYGPPVSSPYWAWSCSSWEGCASPPASFTSHATTSSSALASCLSLQVRWEWQGAQRGDWGGGQDREITVGCSTDHGFACSHSCFPLCKVPSPVKELDLSLITALCHHGHHGRHVAAVHRSPRDTDVLVFTCGCSLVLGTSSPSESGVSDGRTSLCFSPSLSRCLSCSPCC